MPALLSVVMMVVMSMIPPSRVRTSLSRIRRTYRCIWIPSIRRGFIGWFVKRFRLVIDTTDYAQALISVTYRERYRGVNLLFDFFRFNCSLSTVSSDHCTLWLGNPRPLSLSTPSTEGWGWSGVCEDGSDEEEEGSAGVPVIVWVRLPWDAGTVDGLFACILEVFEWGEGERV